MRWAFKRSSALQYPVLTENSPNILIDIDGNFATVAYSIVCASLCAIQKTRFDFETYETEERRKGGTGREIAQA